MSNKKLFFEAIGLEKVTRKSISEIAKKVGIPEERINYYANNNILPSNEDLIKIENTIGVSRLKIMIEMGIFNNNIINQIAKKSSLILPLLESNPQSGNVEPQTPVFSTELGYLYHGDCIQIMKSLDSQSVDLIFADPPFNLSKFYLSNINDNLTQSEYLSWTENWIEECIRILKPGGSFFLWNLPKWNTYFSNFLNHRLAFKHWIATDIKFSLPIKGRLYPSHYSLLMYTKGDKANCFHPDRLPMEICNNCYKELKDYGGYKNKMNPKGINLTDVWLDIPPVRHKKYKARDEANELSIKLLDRIIEMSSNPGDIVFDPFGGSGTTYIVAEMKQRKWIGCELGPVNSIISRFERIEEEILNLEKVRNQYNKLFPTQTKKERKKRGLWTDESFCNLQNELVFQ